MRKPVLLILMFLRFAPAVSAAEAKSTLEPCPKADPSFIHAANETGGIPMFLLRSEAAKSFQLVRESTRSNVSTVFWATGSLRQSEIKDFPTDSLTQRMTIAVSFDTEGGSVSISPPGGASISPGVPNVEWTPLNCGAIVTVTTPRPGNWRVEMRGSGRFWLEVKAQSSLFIVTAEFVRPGGRPGHEGLFPIDGQLVPESMATLRTVMGLAGSRTSQFRLIGESGEPLQEVAMQPVNSENEEFIGSLKVPSVPFRVAVFGIDTNGLPYQRLLPKLFH